MIIFKNYLNMLYNDENKPKVIHLNIAYGKLMQYVGKDQPQIPHNSVEGVLTGIKTVTKMIKNMPYRYLYVYMKDGDENYSIQVPLFKSAGPNIILSLKSALDNKALPGKKVKIYTYQKETESDTFTNATVYLDGEKLSWASLPPDEDREDAIEHIAEEIRLFLEKEGGPSPLDELTKDD